MLCALRTRTGRPSPSTSTAAKPQDLSPTSIPIRYVRRIAAPSSVKNSARSMPERDACAGTPLLPPAADIPSLSEGLDADSRLPAKRWHSASPVVLSTSLLGAVQSTIACERSPGKRKRGRPKPSPAAEAAERSSGLTSPALLRISFFSITRNSRQRDPRRPATQKRRPEGRLFLRTWCRAGQSRNFSS